MNKNYDYLLFDIGGVLLEFSGAPRILEWMNWKVDREEMIRMWLFSESVRSFEKGKISYSDFAESVIKEFCFQISVEGFLEEFILFPKGLYSGVEELLAELSKCYSIACLSNTNELHWKRLCNEFHFDELINCNFLSFKTGFMKPDKEAYIYVIDKLECDPGRILFFDDNKINVDAAKNIGMEAIHVFDFNDLKQKLAGMSMI